jgi:hypothetical protein
MRRTPGEARGKRRSLARERGATARIAIPRRGILDRRGCVFPLFDGAAKRRNLL